MKTKVIVTKVKVYEAPQLVQLGNAQVLVQGGFGNRSESIGYWRFEP